MLVLTKVQEPRIALKQTAGMWSKNEGGLRGALFSIDRRREYGLSFGFLRVISYIYPDSFNSLLAIFN